MQSFVGDAYRGEGYSNQTKEHHREMHSLFDGLESTWSRAKITNDDMRARHGDLRVKVEEYDVYNRELRIALDNQREMLLRYDSVLAENDKLR